MGYITVSEVRSYLDIPSENTDGGQDNANLSSKANYACAIIEAYCNRKFSSNYYVEYHDGGVASVFVNNIPVNNVNSVLEYDGTQYVPLIAPSANGALPNTAANANSTPEFMWYSDSGEFTKDTSINSAKVKITYTGPRVFANYPKGVVITYNGGYDLIPLDVKVATLEYVKLIHKQLEPSTSVNFQGQSLTSMPLSSNLPPHIRRVLDLYRIID